MALTLLIGASLSASVPQLDVIVYGDLGPSDVELVAASWARGSAGARLFSDGTYRIDVPVDSSSGGAGAGRPFAAHEGETVDVLVNGERVESFVISAPGQVVRIDVGSGDGADRFRRADSNDDSAVDIADAIFSLGFMFGGAGQPTCLDALDANDDGEVDLSDPVLTLGFVFLGAAPPPSPGTVDCGTDPTPDSLARCFQVSCGRESDEAHGEGGVAALAAGNNDSEDDSGGRGAKRRTSPGAERHIVRHGAARALARAKRDTRELLGQAVLAGHLRLAPGEVRFGSVQVGRHDLKTVVVHNPMPVDATLEGIVAESVDFAPLSGRCIVPAGGYAAIPVLFAPAAEGARDSRLVLAPGVVVPLSGHGSRTRPHARLGSAYLSSASRTAGEPLVVPVTLASLPAGSEVEMRWRHPHEVVDITALYRRDGDKNAKTDIDFDIKLGVLTATVNLGPDETGLDASFDLVPVDATAVEASAFPLVWESLHVASQPDLDSEELVFGHGDLVTGDVRLDLGGEELVEFDELLGVLRSLESDASAVDTSSWDVNEDGRLDAEEIAAGIVEILEEGESDG